MGKFNYAELGFRCGLEVHQQLAGRKLFCNCPSNIRKDKPDFTINRVLRASAGETGAIDQAAAYELEKGKQFVYHAYNDGSCLVELDEEPPMPPNKEAIETALMMAKLMNMKIVDSIQFMRKIVVDGSNVSGFQRTALIGYDGKIDVNGKGIGIASLCLEEEAAQIVERKKDSDTYNLSRLGIPLLEIATDANISSPDECRDAAEHIGMLLRSTGKVLRGIGTIRQDVNVSIKGGARTEIKGFQEFKSIPKVVDNEIDRQLSLINKGKPVEAGVRKAEADFSTTYLRPMPGADRMYPETDVVTIEPSDIKVTVAETLKEKEERYMNKYALSKDLAGIAIKHESRNKYSFEDDFKKFSSDNLSPAIIVNTILNYYPDVSKKTKQEFDLDNFKDSIFSAVSSGKVAASSIPDILTDIALNGKPDLSKYSKLGKDDIEKELKRIISENKGAPKGMIMGKAMAALKGKAEGRDVMDLLNKLLS